MEYLSHLAKIPLIRGPTYREYAVHNDVFLMSLLDDDGNNQTRKK